MSTIGSSNLIVMGRFVHWKQFDLEAPNSSAMLADMQWVLAFETTCVESGGRFFIPKPDFDQFDRPLASAMPPIAVWASNLLIFAYICWDLRQIWWNICRIWWDLHQILWDSIRCSKISLGLASQIQQTPPQCHHRHLDPSIWLPIWWLEPTRSNHLFWGLMNMIFAKLTHLVWVTNYP